MKNCIDNALNCWGSVTDVANEVLQHIPGICCIREVECVMGCNRVMQQQCFIDYDARGDDVNFFQNFEADLVEFTNPQIEDCGSCGFIRCCRVDRKLGPLLIIDVSMHYREDIDTHQSIRTSSVREITPSLEIKSKKYHLVGAVAFMNRNHFIPYVKSPDGSWDCRDDLEMNNIIKELSEDECNQTKLVFNSLIYVQEEDYD